MSAESPIRFALNAISITFEGFKSAWNLITNLSAGVAKVVILVI